MEHSPDEFRVGRWSWHSCLGCQVEGENLDSSESNIFSVNKCAICSSVIVFKRHFNSFREQLSRTIIDIQVTWRSVNEFKGGSLFPFHCQEQRTWRSVHLDCYGDSLRVLWRGQSKHCLVFRWVAKVSKPKCGLCCKTTLGREGKITRWFQLTLGNLKEQIIVQVSSCSVARPFGVEFKTPTNRLTPAYSANPFCFLVSPAIPANCLGI